jgi:hypothetical protein
MSKGGLVAAGSIVVVCICWLFAVLIFKIMLPKLRAHRALVAKRNQVQQDRQAWDAFNQDSSRRQPRKYELSPYIPSSNDLDHADLEMALRCIYPESAREHSDLPLRNSLTPPDSAPIVTVEKEVPVEADLEPQLSPSKPLVLQGVPTQKFRTRKSSSHCADPPYRVQTFGNYRNIDGVFVKVETESAKMTTLERTSEEVVTRRTSLDHGICGNRGSIGTEISGIATSASVSEAVKIDLSFVAPTVVDVVPSTMSEKFGPDLSTFVIGDGEEDDDA